MAATGASGGDNGECAVCFAEVPADQAAVLVGCRHAFCEPCAARWLSTVPVCPLCKARTSSYVCRGQTVDVQKLGERAARPEPLNGGPGDDAADLSCLDEVFFLEEVERLSSHASHARAHASAASAAALACCQSEISQCLGELRAGAAGALCSQLDPRALMLRLYDLQDAVDRAARGEASPSSTSPRVNETPRRYGADDVYDAEELDEDDEYPPLASPRSRSGRGRAGRARLGQAEELGEGEKES
eukprot:m51a1_g14749 hypothetical protein (245) ;mRNA; f:313583-314844